MKRRLDVFLVEEGYFDSREKSKREIMLGNVIINEQAVTEAGTMIKDNQEPEYKNQGKAEICKQRRFEAGKSTWNTGILILIIKKFWI